MVDKKNALVVLFLAAVLPGSILCNVWVISSASKRVFTSVDAVPSNAVGLLLGAGVRTSSGAMNVYFKNRTEAAAALYRAGKVHHILISGDNHASNYDEPTDMKNYLIELDVPASAITLDYAGFRTLDSTVRARRVFGLDRITIITDQFHAYRAVFLALHTGIDAVAYCSAPVPWLYSTGVRFREIGARVKAPLDLFVLHRQPRFLGPQVGIELASAPTEGQAANAPTPGFTPLLPACPLTLHLNHWHSDEKVRH